MSQTAESLLDVRHHPRAEDFVFDPSRAYTQKERNSFKPHGFWVSVDDDWRRWCESDGMEEWIEHPEIHFSLETEPCLWLKTVEDLDRFTEEYAEPDGYYVDWRTVSMRYAGIIIAPYQWQRRLSLTVNWYYPWDCASACVWDLSVIALQTIRAEATA